MNRATMPATRSPSSAGLTAFQLMNDGHRWWIVTILWQGETSGSPIPKEFLQGVN